MKSPATTTDTLGQCLLYLARELKNKPIITKDRIEKLTLFALFLIRKADPAKIVKPGFEQDDWVQSRLRHLHDVMRICREIAHKAPFEEVELKTFITGLRRQAKKIHASSSLPNRFRTRRSG